MLRPRRIFFEAWARGSGSREANDAEARRARRLQRLIGGGIGLQALIYLYLYVFMYQHANPMGDGMEWVAVLPATAVLAYGTIPAILLCFSRRLLPAGVMVAVVGVVMNAAFLLEIVRELTHWD